MTNYGYCTIWNNMSLFMISRKLDSGEFSINWMPAETNALNVIKDWDYQLGCTLEHILCNAMNLQSHQLFSIFIFSPSKNFYSRLMKTMIWFWLENMRFIRDNLKLCLELINRNTSKGERWKQNFKQLSTIYDYFIDYRIFDYKHFLNIEHNTFSFYFIISTYY